MKRRPFIKRVLTILTTFFVSGGFFGNIRIAGANSFVTKTQGNLLRPPGALPKKEFLSTCINCHRCGQACPNDCIKYVNDPFHPGIHDTPYIRPREKGCILCMKCTQACPSGALQLIENDDGETIQKHVKMGVASVDKNICNSYNGYTCGVCIRACPFGGVALKAETWERPVVIEDKCVGCGLCEQSCIHYPQAIRVRPI